MTTSRRVSSSVSLLFSNVYPDASASAAGTRTMSLLERWKHHLSDQVIFASGASLPNNTINSMNTTTPAAAQSPETILHSLSSQGIGYQHLPPNRSHEMSSFLAGLTEVPSSLLEFVVFDRFYTEEAYSFAIRNEFGEREVPPLILDMQDMHSLRWGRQQLVRDFDATYASDDPLAIVPESVQYSPTADCQHLVRELASIHRCDLSLVCSPHERKLLEGTYGISPSKLVEASFFVNDSTFQSSQHTGTMTHEEKKDIRFVFCGGFKHEPNVDAARLLVQHIFPKIRTVLPKASLHIHGAYPTTEIRRLHNPKSGVFVHGFTQQLQDVFVAGSIVLAPLRHGAGIKGKIVDAWTYGVPVVTTDIGSEGMISSNMFGGRICNRTEEFCKAAVSLATDGELYSHAVSDGHVLLRELYDANANWNKIESALLDLKKDVKERRRYDYTRQMMWHHSTRSTEYFSRWVELKETMPQ